MLKQLMTVLFLMLPALALAAEDYVMYETQYLKPSPDSWTKLVKMLGDHNREFHAEGPYEAWVQRVISGPHTGELVWVMGPCTFTHLDGRPSGDPHDSDWMTNVVPLLDGVTETEYWKMDEEHSYTPDTEPHDLLRVRFFDIERGDMYRFNELLTKINKVRAEKEYPNRTTVYRNQFWSASDRDVAVVWFFDKWAELDDDIVFWKDYEDVFGPGSWRLFLEEWRDVVKDAHDEYREFMPEMAGSASSQK